MIVNVTLGPLKSIQISLTKEMYTGLLQLDSEQFMSIIIFG